MCNSFFFFKQKTAYEMRISDWSSDVCSSDLSQVVAEAHDVAMLPAAIIEVMLPIVVAKDKLVDRLRAIVEGIDQRLADGVLEDRKSTTSELQSLMRISYAVFCLKKTNTNTSNTDLTIIHRNT